MMKKLIALILIVALAAGAVSMATASDYAGGWINMHETAEGGLMMETFWIRDDGTLFYTNRSIKPDGDAWGRDFAGTWTKKGSKIHLVYGNSANADAYLYKGWLVLEIGYGANVVYSPYIPATTGK